MNNPYLSPNLGYGGYGGGMPGMHGQNAMQGGMGANKLGNPYGGSSMPPAPWQSGGTTPMQGGGMTWNNGGATPIGPGPMSYDPGMGGMSGPMSMSTGGTHAYNPASPLGSYPIGGANGNPYGTGTNLGSPGVQNWMPPQHGGLLGGWR
jgi:hypothetical protein